MHTGLRQRNLRELLICLRPDGPRSEQTLGKLKCGEMRWSSHDAGWEIFVPVTAFKNVRSPFFAGNPYCFVLPNLENLYAHIDEYLSIHRKLLVGRGIDMGTFFVRSVRSPKTSASYEVGEFYGAWRKIIQRYGIYNPFTGRGALEGILPHGPHCVRDVLATHILKLTGSYELASYAIQDTPRTVAECYSRFFPQDKAAQAAKILNKVWEIDNWPADKPRKSPAPKSASSPVTTISWQHHRRFISEPVR